MNEQFTINSMPGQQFRVGKLRPTEVLALKSAINFKDIHQSTNVYDFILEHVETNIAGSWEPVKTKNDLYTPATIETNYKALDELVDYFLTNVLMPVFMNSSESK